MNTDVGNVFEYFLLFLNNSDFNDLTQKCNLVKTFLSVWEKSYVTYIKGVLSCDFQIIL